MATVTTTKRNHLTGLMTGFLAVALALLAAGVLWLVVSTSSGSSTEPAPVDRTSVEPSETSKRAVNPNGPGAPASEHSSNWVTGAERAVNPNGPGAPASEHSSNWERAVNPNGPGAPASEHSVDGASK